MKVNGKCLHHKNKKHHSIKFATEKYNLKTSNEKISICSGRIPWRATALLSLAQNHTCLEVPSNRKDLD